MELLCNRLLNTICEQRKNTNKLWRICAFISRAREKSCVRWQRDVGSFCGLKLRLLIPAHKVLEFNPLLLPHINVNHSNRNTPPGAAGERAKNNSRIKFEIPDCRHTEPMIQQKKEFLRIVYRTFFTVTVCALAVPRPINKAHMRPSRKQNKYKTGPTWAI